jgi:ferredoxin-NADP reductase
LIYDVTSSELFKDGKHYFHDTGIDLTVEMKDAPHLEDVMAKFPVVGTLAGSEKSAVNSTIPATQFNTSLNNAQFSKGNVHIESIPSIRLVERTKISTDTYHFVFERPSDFNFSAGQYIKLHVTIGNVEHKRSYSICSTTKQSTIEFVIQLKNGGVVSEQLCLYTHIGDVIPISGPFGNFPIVENAQKELFFICTDVGIGPIRSMLYEIAEKQMHFSKVYLIYGNRTKGDVLFENEWVKMQRSYPTFTYHTVFSRENFVLPFENTGYVHDVYRRLIHDPENCEFYVVGWDRMVHETKQNLLNLGVNKDTIFVQLYI